VLLPVVAEPTNLFDPRAFTRPESIQAFRPFFHGGRKGCFLPWKAREFVFESAFLSISNQDKMRKITKPGLFIIR
jgi:hypothetical protein